MAKLDKSKYTKEEFRILQAQKRKEKLQNKKQAEQQAFDELKRKVSGSPTADMFDNKENNYVLCLKHGDKYSAKYVNTLYSMVKRNLTIPFKMVCLTDNKKDINENILCLDLPKELSGWWCKPYMYSPDLPLPEDSNIRYMDLDVVISGNLNKLFTFQPGKWCVIRDFTRAMQPGWQKYNSSVIRFKHGQLRHVWTDFISNPQKIISTHFGDQDWLWTSAKGTATLWPDEWIRSWKWEVRKDRTLKSGAKGNRKFAQIEDVKPPAECCICVFHGDPNPHNCEDPWVEINWS